MTDISLCSLPGGLSACKNCGRSTEGKMLPRADEFQSWTYPRKSVGTCKDFLDPGDKAHIEELALMGMI